MFRNWLCGTCIHSQTCIHSICTACICVHAYTLCFITSDWLSGFVILYYPVSYMLCRVLWWALWEDASSNFHWKFMKWFHTVVSNDKQNFIHFKGYILWFDYVFSQVFCVLFRFVTAGDNMLYTCLLVTYSVNLKKAKQKTHIFTH